ncbi:hypothetical protein ACLKA7_006188 [Drosophila subpalustris]
MKADECVDLSTGSSGAADNEDDDDDDDENDDDDDDNDKDDVDVAGRVCQWALGRQNTDKDIVYRTWTPAGCSNNKGLDQPN